MAQPPSLGLSSPRWESFYERYNSTFQSNGWIFKKMVEYATNELGIGYCGDWKPRAIFHLFKYAGYLREKESLDVEQAVRRCLNERSLRINFKSDNDDQNFQYLLAHTDSIRSIIIGPSRMQCVAD